MDGWLRRPFRFGPPNLPSYNKKTTEWDNVDFSKKATKDFWDKFPKRELPKKPSTWVDIPALKRLIYDVRKKFTIHQSDAAVITIKNLSEGAPAHQINVLKGGLMKNASSSKQHGPTFTGVLHGWLENGMVAGPFLSPPLPEFRANSLMAIEQKGKIRPILNMSYPEGESFNDNVDTEGVQTVRMSSARQFGQAILKAGKGSLMSKMDMKDAYKHVPAKPSDYRLQGLHFLGAYFVETQQIFGASTAVSNFDNMASTVLDIALAKCDIPRSFVHRTLDDTACVAPAETGWCQNFSKIYKDTCKTANIKLAEDCPRKEKAFVNSTTGTILGIQFNTKILSWRISTEKSSEILNDIHTLLHSGHADLKQIETLAGRLSNFGQMSPFLQAFKRPLNDLLASYREDYNILKKIEDDLCQDMRVWAAVITHSSRWTTIPLELSNPPLNSLHFTSDAAGGLGTEDWAGVASLGVSDNGNFWYLCRGCWPEAIFKNSDEKGSKYASKTTTLEVVGLLLPLLTIPEKVAGKNIVLGVDNIAAVFGWENRSVSGDRSASILIRALHIVASFLETRIFVQHVPRLSSLASIMADNLTRASTAKADVWATVMEAKQYDPPAPLWEWLSDPHDDWQLGLKFVDWINLKN